jgi:amidase
MSLPPRLPTVSQILEIAKTFGMTLTEDAASFCSLMAGSIASYARLDELPEPKLPVKYPRDPGYRPPAEENPYNAWYWKTNITGAKGGVLAGERVAVKDNICVAGVPMMNGSRVLEGYVPEVDATVVTRVLDAGGVIAGKATASGIFAICCDLTRPTIRGSHSPFSQQGRSVAPNGACRWSHFA